MSLRRYVMLLLCYCSIVLFWCYFVVRVLFLLCYDVCCYVVVLLYCYVEVLLRCCKVVFKCCDVVTT